jgi:hypothetical protein
MPSWFDPRMTIGNVITIAVVAIAAIGAFYANDNRIAAIERQQVILEAQTAKELLRLDSRVASTEATRLADIAQLQEMNGRMIRMEEKQAGQGETLQRILRSVERSYGSPDRAR